MSELTRTRGAIAVAVGLAILWGFSGGTAWGQAVVTAGPAGDYTGPTAIQDAIDDALGGLSGEVRIQAGLTFYEHLTVNVSANHYLKVSGGWNDSFDLRTNDPSLSVIDGSLSGRVVTVFVESGSTFYLENLTIQNGQADWSGGGLYLVTTDADEVGLYDDVFKGNSALSTQSHVGIGGALYVVLQNTWAEVQNSRFFDNGVRVQPEPALQGASGGGIYADLEGSSHLAIMGNLIDGCYCLQSAGTGAIALGCGVRFVVNGSSVLDMDGNVVVNVMADGFGEVTGLAGYVGAFSTGVVEMERNRWQRATILNSSDPKPTFVHVVRQGESLVTQRSSLIADSPAVGLYLDGDSSAANSWRGGNLTIAGHGASAGLVIDGGGDGILWNSLVFRSLYSFNWGSSFTGGWGFQNSLLDTDPGCVNPEDGYYQLARGSSVLDSGNNNPDLVGITTLDLAGEARLQGPNVDFGAYEGTTMIWASGFESGTTTWSSKSQ